MINEHCEQLLDAGLVRYNAIAGLHRAGRVDAAILAPMLIGLRCKKLNKEYVITRVDYGYNGHITAHGYRILGSGQRGTKTWDIGTIHSGNFE